jgi:ATP-dependent helicase YprA (DUF1998 family)
MRELDPIHATSEIHGAYLRYLRTAYPLQDPVLRTTYQRVLEQADLVKGPLLEASPPFRLGRSLEELISEGVVHSSIRRLGSEDHLPLDRKLYRHQDRAIDHLVRARRNAVIATGTGSGKTECFLLPIFDHLMREHEAQTLVEPGVRALLLYPMNALANDQLKRLRQLLKYVPEITFGRYTGETKQGKADATKHFEQFFPSEPRLANELLSREEMRERPPQILLTNYAMLEYLLLRPEDCDFFDGTTGRHWRFLVLDEAHTYDGAIGIEMAMLLRRLKDRVVRSEPGRLRCIATSATLGRGRDDFPKVAAFAQALFGERFEWVADDPAYQDVIEPERAHEDVGDARWEGTPALYRSLREAIATSASAGNSSSIGLEPLVDVARASGAPPALVNAASRAAKGYASTSKAFLWGLLQTDRHLIQLRERLAEQPRDLDKLAPELFAGHSVAEGRQGLVDLVGLGVHARVDSDAVPLLPARYHLFVRALEGAFICLRDHRPGDGRSPRLFLERREACPECKAIVFEFAACARCGAGYLVGELELTDRGLERLRPLSPIDMEARRPTYVLLGDESGETDEDEEVAAEPEGLTVDADAARLCLGCGALLPDTGPGDACGCASDTASRMVRRRPLKPGEERLPKCVACSALAGTGEVVFRFLTGQDAPVAVLATALYQQIPPDTRSQAQLPAPVAEGRKFLSFADSRQDAAFFAPYLQRTYDRLLHRRLLAKTAREAGDAAGGRLRLQDLAPRLQLRADAAGLFTQQQSEDERRRETWTWLLQELMAWDRQNSLEGLGVAHFRLVRPKDWQPPAELQRAPWRLSQDESWTLTCLLLDSLRQQGVLTFPDGVNPSDETFAPRNRAFWVREQSPEPRAGIFAWRPQRGQNRRSNLLLRLVQHCAPDADQATQQLAVDALLGVIWKDLTAPNGVWRDHLVVETHRQHGTVFRISHEFWEVAPTTPGDAQHWYRCDTCRMLTPLNVRDLCPRYRCRGTLAPWQSDMDEWNSNHYRYLYDTMDPLRLVIEEHTAQLTSEAAAHTQERFVRGEISALSCSTTFELGVDVGDLQAVLMRNVPPTTANYVQRAGRAGRRTDATAFALTFAQRRSHDLTHYRNPRAMVAGKITPPMVRLENEPIIRRHMHAVLFAAFLRGESHLDRRHRSVGAFFTDGEPSERGSDRLRRFAEEQPADVQAALRRILPPEVPAAVNPNDWLWLEEIYDDKEGTGGLLGRVYDEVRGDLDTLEQMERDAVGQKRYSSARHFKHVAETLRRRDLLGFLCNRGLLPKYGFPVDVVDLRTEHASDEAGRRLELQRDLRIAISEYAPTGEIIAGGRLWRSRGLHLIPNRALEEYEYAYCRMCGWFALDIAGGGKVPNRCASCSQVLRSRGTFVKPVFGFVADANPGAPGEARPRRSYASRIYFSRYDVPGGEREHVDWLRPDSPIALRLRYARYGWLAVINAGPEHRGFRICRTCGYADVPSKVTRKTGDAHKHPWTGKKCSGELRHRHLGHEFLTDTLELELTGVTGVGSDSSDWRSLLYAVLEGAARALSIARDDLDGTLHGSSADAPPALILFDDVPGGAGYCRRIHDALPQVFREALAVVENCDCGEETSCYQCLRNFRNQPYHDHLRRDAALNVLRQVVASYRD